MAIKRFHCTPGEIDIPSEQTELHFAFVNLCCFLIIFSVSSLKYVRKIFNNYLTLSNKNESYIASHSFRKDKHF